MESPLPVPAVRVNKIAPVVPIKIPIDRPKVIFSFNKKKDRMTTKIGLTAMIIPEFIEEDKFNP